jgi:hypothetical protein
MWKKLIYAVAAALVAVVAVIAVDRLRGSGGGGFDEGVAQQADLLLNTGARLREAGTAEVAFRADLRTDVGTGKIAWTGTSRIRFADQPQSDTDYAEVASDAGGPIEARRLVDGEDAYVTSASFAPADRRRWIRTPTTTMFWPDPLASPELGLTDYPMWQKLLDDTQRDNAVAAGTDDLPDLAGAPNEYRLTCTPGEDTGCPPPFGTQLDQYFTAVPNTTWSIWLGDDGRPRRVDVAAILQWDQAKAQPGDTGPAYKIGTYEYHATFEVGGFGTPVTVTAPAADEITRVRVVSAKK